MKNSLKYFIKKLGMFEIFLFWFVQGTLRTQPLRWVVVTLTISLGITLAVAINIVNKSAINEFNHATSALKGNANFQIKAKTGFFNELIFEEFLNLKKKFGILEISPVLELSLVTKDNKKINILGLDFFRAVKTTPVFSAIPDQNKNTTSLNGNYKENNKLSVFSQSSIFLSPVAQKKFGVSIGDPLTVFHAGQEVVFYVGGVLANSVGDNVAVVDIAAFQNVFNMYGKLSRLDFKVLSKNNSEESKFLVSEYLSTSKHQFNLEVVSLNDSLKKNNNLSRAYYVNLSVLALIALFTGMFLVYSVLNLSVQQQSIQFAILRVLGLTKRELIKIIVSIGFSLSFIGSTLGVIFGLCIAKLLLSSLNANLGASLIFQNATILHIDWLTLIFYWLLGIFVGVIASLIPATRISKVSPKISFTSSEKKNYVFGAVSPLTFFILIAIASLLLFLPSFNGIPFASYVSIALILFAFIGVIPKISSLFLRLINALFLNLSKKKFWIWLGLNRLTNTSGEISSIISSVVASFALTISILIMITSFKSSVINWLDKLLVADIYGSVKESSGYSKIDENLKRKIEEINGIKRVELSKNFSVSLDPTNVNVDMIVKQLDHKNPESQLIFVGEKLSYEKVNHYIKSAKKIVIYASESVRQIYNFNINDTPVIPFPGEKFSEVVIGGFYRDYSHQHGSILVKESDFRTVTGNSDLKNLAIWLETDAEPQQVVLDVKNLGEMMKEMNFKSSQRIRDISLKIFDQTFYVAYLLGIVALFISIFSIFCTYITQAKVREKEFSLLMHLGLSKQNIEMQTSFESGLLCFFGVFWGLIAGTCISLILIYVVNPQSFYWTMDFKFPLNNILLLAFLLIVSGVLSSKLAVKNELKKNLLGKVLKKVGTSFG